MCRNSQARYHVATFVWLSCAVARCCTVAAQAHASAAASKVYSLLFETLDDKSPDIECMPWAVPLEDRCEYIHSHAQLCGEGSSFIKYLHLYYCSLGRWPLLGNALLALWVIFLLVVLTVVADRFFCPALEVVSDFLQLPANVAGATLLSFGNGAPDLFTQLAAVSSMDASSVPMAIGEPLGGGLFVSNVVLAACVFIGGQGSSVSVEKHAFLRDTGFYIVAILLIIAIASDGQVALWEMATLLAFYALFVAYIVVFARRKSSAMHIEESRHYQQVVQHAAASAHSNAATHSHAATPLVSPDASTARVTLSENASHGRIDIAARHEPAGEDTITALSPRRTRHSDEAHLVPASPPRYQSHLVQRRPTPDVLELPAPGDSTPAASRSLKRFVTMDSIVNGHRVVTFSVPEGADDDLLQPLVGEYSGLESDGAVSDEGRTWSDLVQLPVVWLLRLTMPEVGMDDEVSYPKPFAVLLPITAPLFVVLAKGLAMQHSSPLGPDAVIYGATCSAFSSAVIYAIYPRTGRHYGILSGMFTVMTFAMSILWMDVAAAEMVRACKVVGYIHGLSQAMLGVTVLAWANSFGDLIADVTMARDGFPSMAVAACFASPLFTATAGLGLSFTIAILQHGELTFHVTLPFRIALAFGLLSIARFLIFVPTLLGWRISRATAASMLLFYVIFQVVYIWAMATSEDAQGSQRN